MRKKWFLFITLLGFIVIVSGCSDDEESKKDGPKGITAKSQKNEKVDAGPLLQSAAEKLKSSQGSAFSLIGSQQLSLQGEENPATNQIDMTGEEKGQPATITHLNGKINQQKPMEFYLTNGYIYEKIGADPWTKRAAAVMQRKPADSLILANKIIEAIKGLANVKGAEAEKQGSIYILKIPKKVLDQASPSLSQEIQTYQQTALDSEISKKNPGKKTEGLTIDDIGAKLILNANTKEVTKITTNLKTTFQLDQQTHVIEEDMEKSLTGPLSNDIQIPSNASSAQEIK
ncbi:hypothetical protein SAMN05444392_101588 [Seinonella peptonophila]|uniref:Uncharacterized protein n=1 Tax=Seinonella peptonophila TaxID=112248 RepID=A0A1M4TQP4_9BACL|nr:hypothetical protein [Seinonella peptonophila]SHE46716.1 hypothetical protein SAMN05444392_101588 [Seinonella peptonophila]